MKKPSRARAGWGTWGVVGLLVLWFASPNLQHAANYHSHVVYPIKTMEVLEELNQASDPDDFVVTWWDYGSGVGIMGILEPLHPLPTKRWIIFSVPKFYAQHLLYKPTI